LLRSSIGLNELLNVIALSVVPSFAVPRLYGWGATDRNLSFAFFQPNEYKYAEQNCHHSSYQSTAHYFFSFVLPAIVFGSAGF
jgi:hypothetical protein